MNFIVTHSVYANMPDAISEDHKIQWEAPSNRKGGKYQHTHVKRLDWWRRKAESIGIQVGSEHWISRTAKKIHPTGEKPCKRCGNKMLISYSYPQARLLKKINEISFIDESFEFEDFVPITEIVDSLHLKYGDAILPPLISIVKNDSSSYAVKNISFLGFRKWLEGFIKSEPKGCLSPGVMSNAPDRFEGFHSFNLCCRSKADTGRFKENLQSYSTDRRVFENWNQGDWISADRLMGQVRMSFKEEPCKFGHPGPCDADHIGPISLGFCHRPKFQLLCSKCNSAKNNRMSYEDILLLKHDEAAGEQVVSWHTEPVWSMLRDKIHDNQDALKASKVLRDYSFYPLEVFNLLLEQGNFLFLLSQLELDYADYDPVFKGLSAKEHTTYFEKIERSSRTTKYARVQKSRRIRIAFIHLKEFIQKENRQVFRVESWNIEQLTALGDEIQKIFIHAKAVNKELALIFEDITMDNLNAGNFNKIEPYIDLIPKFKKELDLARIEMKKYLTGISVKLINQWDSDRYSR